MTATDKDIPIAMAIVEFDEALVFFPQGSSLERASLEEFSYPWIERTGFSFDKPGRVGTYAVMMTLDDTMYFRRGKFSILPRHCPLTMYHTPRDSTRPIKGILTVFPENDQSENCEDA